MEACELGCGAPPATWQAGEFEGVVAIRVTLATFGSEAKMEFPFSFNGGRGGTKVIASGHFLSLRSGEGDHN